MGEDKIEFIALLSEYNIEFIALLSQDNMKFLQKVWVEEEKTEKIKPGYFPFQFLFLQVALNLRSLKGS